MRKQEIDIQAMRVAKPCSAAWEEMTGDERSRMCSQCSIRVYNIEEMTASEVRDFVFTNEGRTCIRLHRRADGTVITKDCPKGLQRMRKRAFGIAAAAFAAVLGLFSISFGQKGHPDPTRLVPGSTVEQTCPTDPEKDIAIQGVVMDTHGASIPGVKISVVQVDGKNEKKIARALLSDTNGKYIFPVLPDGEYRLKAEKDGFRTIKIEHLSVQTGCILNIDMRFEVSSDVVTVGIFLPNDNPIDPTSSSVDTTITREMIERLPH